MPTNAAPITPDTTVADLLRHYPHLDEPLACLVPSYGALSPALRATVGSTLTIFQLSANGNVALGPLVTALREAAGVTDSGQEPSAPAWATQAARTVTLDARPIIAAGGHPLHEVMQGLAALGETEVYEMVTPFVPAPLVEMARGRGFDACSIWDGDVVRTYFRRVQR